VTPPSLRIPTNELALDAASIRDSFVNHLQHTQGKHPRAATPLDHFVSVARTARDRMFDRWTRTWQQRFVEKPKIVYYLSMEYLLGRLLEDSLINIGILEETRAALAELGIDLDTILHEEPDPGLGNGGLGRLAACFLDSLATLGIAAMGYGIRYEYGIFGQEIVGGQQNEAPDLWLQFGSPWDVARPERIYDVHFGGRVIHYTSSAGRTVHEWVDTYDVRAMAYDIPVPGYRNGVVNTLRLWSAKATQAFDISYFNRGDYAKAVERKVTTENISRVLYPADTALVGKELRLQQEYFLVSATLQDAVQRHLTYHANLNNLHHQAVFQLNDTHPALAVTELLRLLMDVHGLTWDHAWSITTQCMAYTNHTILPEALERWPLWLLERLLPRHLQLIYEINHRFLQEVRQRYPGDEERIRRMSLIEEGAEKYVRMANLAVVGARRVNGVSALHSRLLKETLFRDFNDLWPGKITNQTNGVTPRRWLLKCNPELARLITRHIGDRWVRELDYLEDLAPLADDPEFCAEFREIKRRNKRRLADGIWKNSALEIDPEALLDVQIKRIHEYKRQLLNILHVVLLYLDERDNPSQTGVRRTFLFAGKAAPGYEMARRIIHLITSVGAVIGADARVRERLRVVFVPNYSVSLAELIIPASEVSEQISTAGFEASGTGNMKLALNGALTVGTLDGANIEIRDAVGEENVFLFGLSAEEVMRAREQGYHPERIYYSEPPVRRVLDAVASGTFSPEEPGRFRPIVDALLRGDHFMVLADFLSYVSCQREVATAYARDPAAWTRRAVLNVARMGHFSSDRTIAGYASEIWGLNDVLPSGVR
jgi:starch phosphorylase